MQQQNELLQSADELRATLEMLIDADVDKAESQVLLEMLNRGDVEAARCLGGTMWLAREAADFDWLTETGTLILDLVLKLFVERKVVISVNSEPEARVDFVRLYLTE